MIFSFMLGAVHKLRPPLKVGGGGIGKDDIR